MKRLFFVIVLLGLFLSLDYIAEAGDIEAVLDSADGSSSFSVKDSGNVEVSHIDSNGNIQADGTITTVNGLTDQSAVSYLGTKIINYSTTSDFTIEPRVTSYDLLLQPTGTGGVGIGTTTPDTKLHVRETNASNNIAKFENSGTTRTTYINQWADLYLDSSSTLYTNSLKSVAGDTSVDIAVGSHLDFGWGRNLKQVAEITTNLLGVGATTFGGATSVIAIGNAVTVPTASIAEGVLLYAEDVTASSELKVRDEAGNITTLSPHNFTLVQKSEPMAWSFYSENHKLGKKINVDMLKVVRLLEDLTGEKLVYIADIEEPNSNKITEQSSSKKENLTSLCANEKDKFQKSKSEDLNVGSGGIISSLAKSIRDLDKKVEKLEKQNKRLEASLRNYKLIKAVDRKNPDFIIEALNQ